MLHESLGAAGLNYAPCRYTHSKLNFRGPRRPLEGGYIAVLGDGATYGKFVREPFPNLLEQRIGRTCVNLGIQNAGIDAFLKDSAVLSICKNADLVVLQVSEIQNMSNRFYRVHPRRNDRFLEASSILKVLYPTVDFAEIDFSHHLLRDLSKLNHEKFAIVQTELQEAWVARTRMLLTQIGPKVIVCGVPRPKPVLGSLAVTDGLLQRVSDLTATTIRIPETNSWNAEGMVFSIFQREQAEYCPDIATHVAICDALVPEVASRLGTKKARGLFPRAFGNG